MPGFPFPGRPGGLDDEPLLDIIFDRRPLPPQAPTEMHDLARMLSTAAGPTEPGELAGEAAALVAFSHFASPAGVSTPAPGPARRRRFRLPASGRARLATGRARLDPRNFDPRNTDPRKIHPRKIHPRSIGWARLATALVVTACLCGAAAFIGVLPGPLQQVAHVTVGAPAPHGQGVDRWPSARRPRPAPKAGTVPGNAGSPGAARAPGKQKSPGHHAPRRKRRPAVPDCSLAPSFYQRQPGQVPTSRLPGAGCPGTPGRSAPAGASSSPVAPTPSPSKPPTGVPGANGVSPTSGGPKASPASAPSRQAQPGQTPQTGQPG